MFTLCARLSRHVCRRDRQRWERCAKSTAAAGPSELGESLGDGDVNPNHQALIWYKTHIYIYYTYVLLDIFQIIWFSCNGGTCGHHTFLGFPWNKASILGYPHLWKPPYDIHIFWPVDFIESIIVSVLKICAPNHNGLLGKGTSFFFTFSIFFSCFFFPRASERRVLPIVGVCISSSHLQSSHLHTFSSSYLLPFTSSHLHTFSSSRLLTSHLLIFTSSHLLIFTSSHFTSSHFTSSHLHISSSHCPHLLIFTSAHLHIFSSSNILIFTSSHLHICSSSHLHIFTSAHLHIFSSSHLHIFTSSHLHIFSSCPLALFALSFFSISLLKAGAGAVPTRRHETQPFRTKRGSIVKNWRKIAISTCPRGPRATLSHETRFDRQKTEVKIAISGFPVAKPFARKWGSIAKNWGKSASSSRPAQHFRPKWGSIVKSWGKIAISGFPLQPFSHENEGRSPKNWGKSASSSRPAQPFRTKWGSIVKNWGKIAISTCPAQPFRTKRGSIVKNWGKIVIFSVCTKLLCAVRQSFYV